MSDQNTELAREERAVNFLHEKHGRCNHCGKIECAGKKSGSTLPDKIPTRDVLQAISFAATEVKPTPAPHQPKPVVDLDAIRIMVKITPAEGGGNLIVSLDEFGSFRETVGAEPGAEYRMKLITMTERQVQELPEFDGF